MQQFNVGMDGYQYDGEMIQDYDNPKVKVSHPLSTSTTLSKGERLLCFQPPIIRTNQKTCV